MDKQVNREKLQAARGLLPHAFNAGGLTLALGVIVFLFGFQTPVGLKPLLIGILFSIACLRQFLKDRMKFLVQLQTPLDLPIITLLLIILMTLPRAQDLLNSLRQLAELLVSLGVYYLIASRVLQGGKKDHLMWVFRFWLGSLGILTLSGVVASLILYSTGKLPSWALYSTRTGRPRLTLMFHYYNPDSYATFLLIGFLFLLGFFIWEKHRLNRFRRIATLAFIGVLEWNLLFTLSRGAWIAMLGGLAFLWSFSWFIDKGGKTKRILAGTTLILVLVASVWVFSIKIFSPPFFESFLFRSDPTVLINEQDQDRKTLWSGSWNMFLANPWGVGWGNFSPEYLQYKLPGALPTSSPHNLLLEVATELGIPGLIVLAWLLVKLAGRTAKAIRKTTGKSGHYSLLVGLSVALVGILFQGLTETILFVRIFWFLIGLLGAIEEKES